MGRKDSAPREEEPVRTVADEMEWRVKGVNRARSINEAGSPYGCNVNNEAVK